MSPATRIYKASYSTGRNMKLSLKGSVVAICHWPKVGSLPGSSEMLCGASFRFQVQNLGVDQNHHAKSRVSPPGAEAPNCLKGLYNFSFVIVDGTLFSLFFLPWNFWIQEGISISQPQSELCFLREQMVSERINMTGYSSSLQQVSLAAVETGFYAFFPPLILNYLEYPSYVSFSALFTLCFSYPVGLSQAVELK